VAVHFVYATYPGSSLLARVGRRAVILAQKCGISASCFWDRFDVDSASWPVRAPLSITAHVLQALQARGEVALYDWNERVSIKGGNSDVLLGHPYPDDDSRVWNRSCREGRFAARIAMTPLSHQMVEICGRLDPYVSMVDAILGIMGPYWYDTWEGSALAHWRNKIVPIDMAVDVDRFPKVKMRFNPPGKRKFFYLGWSGPQKGTHLLSILFGLAKGNQCVAIGPGRPFANVEHRPAAKLDMAYLHRLADECDFFITMGVSDANPTTILESMAWGFPVCCTPQSGYYNMPELLSLSITDMRHNLAVLEMLQNAPASELHARAQAARTLVARKYTWQRFTDTAMGALDDIGRARGFDPWGPTRRSH
jgi:hypothetical protein